MHDTICRLLYQSKPMYRKLLSFLLPFLACAAIAQNPSTVIQLSQKEIIIPCGTACTSVTATVPHIRQSNDYVVQAIPNQPFDYLGGTELTALYADDIYSSTISLPFPVCFYGNMYSSLVVGSNGLVTFDISNAGKRNNFRQTVSFSNTTPVPIPYAGGMQNSLSQTNYPKAAIMGVYHDIFPFDNGSRRIEWRVEGTAPKRRFLASYKDVPMYSCTSQTARHQIVVYESTGVVEVYVQDKPVCTAWNQGLAILGMQNFTRDKAVFPDGKNAGQWGASDMNEAYRFTPAAGNSLFKRAELLAGGTVVAVADTASGAAGELNLTFNSVCSLDSTKYIVRVTYQACNGTGEVSFEDSVIVRKEKLQVSLQTTQPTCGNGGIIKVAATGAASPLLYSLNSGPLQSSPEFNGLKAGNYTVTVAAGNTCSKSITTTLTLEDDLLLVAQPSATVCAGESFTPQILSNAESFTWSPSAGVSNTAESHPQITAQQSTVYTITAVKGDCRKTATLALTVKPLPTANAGPDKTIIEGDGVQLTATATAGSYAWTPPTTLTLATGLQPTANPMNTTTYRLSVTANGCTATDEVTVTVVPYCVKPMEAFSPNGDGINDRWMVTTGSCLQQAKVEVFNRYGAPVFQSADYKNTWNGTFDGKPLPDGTYYYIISYQLINGKMVHLKGSVTILR